MEPDGSGILGGRTGTRARTRARTRPALRRLLVFGITSEDPLAAPIQSAARGPVAFCADVPSSAPLQNVKLALGVRTRAEDPFPFDFARWAFTAGIPSLGVEVDANGIRIGPLALPARAGCWNCARERMLAAAAPFEPKAAAQAEVVPPDVLAALAGPTLVREIRAILRRGAPSSPLIDNILAIDAATCTASLHRFVPLPCCLVCGGVAAFPRTPAAPANLSSDDPPEAVIEALAGVLDWRTGIVSRLVIEPPAETGVDLPLKP